MKSELQRLCDKLGVVVESKFGAAPFNPNFPEANTYKVTLRLEGRQLTTNFYQGEAITEDPTAADVLSCLVSDVNGVDGVSFDGWCSDFGYSNDSIKARDTYNAYKRMVPKLKRFLGKHFETVSRAEH